MQCPNCQLKYSKQPQHCSCGYDFKSGTVTPASPAVETKPHDAHDKPQVLMLPANRMKRLGAKIFDGLLAASPLFLLVDTDPEQVVFELIFAVVVILGVQWYMLTKMGQTIGKYLLRIRIVKLDGSNGGFVSNVLIREIANGLLNFIPLYGVVDGLLIFRQDQRCIHDHLAGTVVITAEE